MIAAMESARAAGADIAPFDFWRREADFDVLHLWGLDKQHSSTVKWAHAGGKKIVMTALVNYLGWRSWLRYPASLAVGQARLHRQILATIDVIIVVNRVQARYLIGAARVPAEKVMVVPNQIDDVFFETGPGPEPGVFGIENYVLCVGNIRRLKNQLTLIGACRKLGVPLLLVGNVLTGEEDYGRAVAEAVAAGKDMRWIPWLTPGSVELASAYRGAAVFALLSHLENQPISALEAAASRKPLVLADRPYARQEFYERAARADPNSVDAIARAIRKALDNPDAHCPPPLVIEHCRKEEVGAAYMSIYQRLVEGAA
jgi:glycosyltransferase involved in cell wall biosynthesis